MGQALCLLDHFQDCVELSSSLLVNTLTDVQLTS